MGAAFQKVNFLRDLKDDYQNRGRTYFPNLNLGLQLDERSKREIEEDIEEDFEKDADSNLTQDVFPKC